MTNALADKVVAVIGGDKRDAYVVNAFVREGARVRVLGVPGVSGMDGIEESTDPITALTGAHCVVAPISGVHPDGQLRVSEVPVTVDDRFIDAMSPGAVFLIGLATAAISQACGRRGIRLIEYMNLDEVAILNSIPSAEGAIQMIMAETPITVHGSRIAVLGFGRTGMTTAHKLRALGANVTVFARKPLDLARANALDLKAEGYAGLENVLRECDVVVNTVPVPILPRRALGWLKPDCFVLDLASTPGGVDYNAARELGIKAVLAPGLPGRVAPRTAGEFLARILPRLAKSEMDLA